MKNKRIAITPDQLKAIRVASAAPQGVIAKSIGFSGGHLCRTEQNDKKSGLINGAGRTKAALHSVQWAHRRYLESLKLLEAAGVEYPGLPDESGLPEGETPALAAEAA